MNNNLFWHNSSISLAQREQHNNHRAVCLWFTGLSGSGKSTLANLTQERLFSMAVQTYILDGDNIRHGLNSDLGFSAADRVENIRRVGEVAKLFVDSGTIIITAFISPFREDRNRVRKLLGDRFIEIFVDSDLEICKKRDPKGLYEKAERGEISDFTGISSPYEAPENPEIHLINNTENNLEKNIQTILDYLILKNIVN